MLLINSMLLLTRTQCSVHLVNLPPIGSCPILYIVQDHVCTGACCFYSPKSETQHNFLQNIHLYMQLIQPYYNVHILFRNNSGLKLNKGVLRAQLSFQKDQLRYQKADTGCHQPQITSSKEVQLAILAVLAESYDSPPRDSKSQFNDRKIHKQLQLQGMCATVKQSSFSQQKWYGQQSPGPTGKLS